MNIAELNDRFRSTFVGGQVLLTSKIAELGPLKRQTLLQSVAAFDEFSEDNDPHHEHDFGAFDFDGDKVFWKIDYYNNTMDGGSENPADPAQTTRVLTVMYAHEY